MRIGRLRYNEAQGRYGIEVQGEWWHEGLHCGEGLEVYYEGKWIHTGIEMGESWYLVGTVYKGNLENIPVRIS